VGSEIKKGEIDKRNIRGGMYREERKRIMREKDII